MDIKNNLEDLAKMIVGGQILEAFEKYYADDVVMQENNDEPRVGKDVNRKYEEAFVNGIDSINEFKVLGMAVGDDYSTMETYIDAVHKEWGPMKMSQVAVQKWKDGKIVSKKFYYSK